MRVDEYEHEPVRGLPEYLPRGERLVWQGEPAWSLLARRVFFVRAISLYFLLLVAWHFGSGLYAGRSLGDSLAAGSWQIGLGITAIAILALIAWAYARSTVYTITEKRLVMRFGVAMPMMVNIPLDMISAADLRRYSDGSGDILFTVARREDLSYMMLWPNVRPWHFRPVQPALRGLADVESVAAVLANVVSHADRERSTPTDAAIDEAALAPAS